MTSWRNEPVGGCVCGCVAVTTEKQGLGPSFGMDRSPRSCSPMTVDGATWFLGSQNPEGHLCPTFITFIHHRSLIFMDFCFTVVIPHGIILLGSSTGQVGFAGGGMRWPAPPPPGP